MVKYRDKTATINRLLAYYRKNDIIKDFQSSHKIYDGVSLEEDEFGIDVSDISNKCRLVITSRRLIVKSHTNSKIIPLEEIKGIFIGYPFKKEENYHILSIYAYDGIIYQIRFETKESLAKARNELFKIISIVIEDWRGKHFNIEEVNVDALISPVLEENIS